MHLSDSNKFNKFILSIFYLFFTAFIQSSRVYKLSAGLNRLNRRPESSTNISGFTALFDTPLSVANLQSWAY